MDYENEGHSPKSLVDNRGAAGTGHAGAGAQERLEALQTEAVEASIILGYGISPQRAVGSLKDTAVRYKRRLSYF